MSKRLARYHCEARGLFQFPTGEWGMIMRVLDDHANAPKGSEGSTSALRSIDFEHGVAVTQNSVYIFDPKDFQLFDTGPSFLETVNRLNGNK